MSYSADPQHLFELQQLLSVGGWSAGPDSPDQGYPSPPASPGSGGGPSGVCPGGGGSDLNIRAYDVTSCGRAIVFVAGGGGGGHATVLGSLLPPCQPPFASDFDDPGFF